jgi:hypothetical protein
LDDLAGAQYLRDRLVHHPRDRFDRIAAFGRELALPRPDEVDGGGQRLVELVRQGAGHLPGGAEARTVKKLRLQLLQANVRALSLDNLGPELPGQLLKLAGPLGDALLQRLVEPAQFGFGLFALGDVPRDLRGADNPAVVGADRRDGQGDSDLAAILVAPYRLVMLDPLTPLYLIEDHRHLILAARCSQQENRASDDLLCPISEDRFGGSVPGCDGPVQVRADDSVVRGFDDGGGRWPIPEGRSHSLSDPL